MKRTKWTKVFTLGLILTTVSFDTAMASINNGTHDVGGTINLTGTYVDATGDVTLNATSDVNFITSNSIYMLRSNTANKNVNVNMNGYSITAGPYGRFIDVEGVGAQLNIINAYDINASCAKGATNLLLVNGKDSSISLQANHDITIYSWGNNPGISSQFTPSKITIIAGNNFTNHGGSGNPVNVGYGTKCTITAGQDMYMDSTGNLSGIYTSDAGTKLSLTATNGQFDFVSTGGNTGSIRAENGAAITIHAAKDINIGGNAQRALRSSGTLDITSDIGAINLTATNTDYNNNAGIYASKSGAIVGAVNLHSDTNITAVTRGVHADGGTVTFDKGVTTAGTATAFAANQGGKITALTSASAKKLMGDLTADGSGSSVDVNLMTSDSYLTGATSVSNSGAVDLELGNGGMWNVTGNSALTNLANNSTVNMRYTGNSTNETITAANLSGNGTYIMNTDLQASYDTKNVQNSGDKIIITTSSSGANVLDLRDISLDTKLASQGYLLLVEDQSNGNATFSGKDLAHGGIFKYKPVIVNDNPTDYSGFNASAKNWYLTGFEKTIEVSDNTNTTLGLAETRYGNYFTDNDTLLKRLGELRMMKDQSENDGVWTKYRHGIMGGKKFDGNFTTFQIGYDKKTSDKRYTGAAFSHTDNSFDLGAGTGEGSMDALTVYNTWLGDKNHYFDIVGKAGRMRGDSKYVDSLFPERGEYGNWFYSVIGEYGRKNINNSNGWYYEPQVQLTLGRINGADYTTSLGTTVKMDAINSVLGRMGVTIGREYNTDNPAKRSNVYGKINLLHEFRGDVTTSFLDSYGDGYCPTAEYGGTWLNAGIGAMVNFDKNTHLYFDLEKNFKGAVTSKWVGQVGCRWTWK